MSQITKEELLDCFATEAMKALLSQETAKMGSYHLAREAYTIAQYMVERKEKILQEWKLAEEIVEHGIDKLNLTVRTERCLKSEGIITLQQLQGLTEHRLMRIPNLGLKSKNEIVMQMASLGYKLKDRT